MLSKIWMELYIFLKLNFTSLTLEWWHVLYCSVLMFGNSCTSLGIIFSICTPVTHNNNLKGVICIDESYDKIFASLNFYKQGQISYPFLLDTTTKIILHPKVPIAQEITNHPAFTYLSTLETGANIEEMIASILR